MKQFCKHLIGDLPATDGHAASHLHDLRRRFPNEGTQWPRKDRQRDPLREAIARSRARKAGVEIEDTDRNFLKH